MRRAHTYLNNMLPFKEYSQIINSELGRLELPDTLPGLYDPIRYALASGGKRLRPAIMLMACEAFGGMADLALWPAIGVEIFHNFTLLHDDVMDHASTRRGRPTVAAKFGVNAAILSGDAMTSLAFKCAASCDPQFLPEMMDRFAAMTMGVYDGQQMDADMQAAPRATFQQYLTMVVGKTSALIAYPCAMGAMLAGAMQADIEAMFNFGISLGIAFQMQDDWLDVFGDPATFGKAIGGDILEGKKTWLHIIATDRGSSLARAEGETDQQLIARVTDIYTSLGLREQGRELIARYTDDALEALAASSMDTPAREAFTAVARKLISRDA